MLVEEVKVKPGDSLLIPGDMHHDKQDQRAIELMIKVARAARVNHVCLVGDTFESAGISRHPSMRRRKNVRIGKGTIKAERKAAQPNLDALKTLATRGANCLTGNHEAWFDALQDEVPGLLDHEWWELYGDLFDGWTIRDEATALKYGPLLVCHGHRLRGSLAKYAAATILANYPGQNTVCGHNHRLSSETAPTFKYGKQVWHGAWTVGHLKDRVEELREPNIGPYSEKHQQGFAIATFFSRGRAHGEDKMGFDLQLYRIHRDVNDNPMVHYSGAVFK